MSNNADRTARRLSPLLLVLAALCFLLPFIGVSCNTAAGSAALGSLGSIGASGDSSGAAQSAACLRALDGRDLYTYSGLNLATGSDPTAQTNIPGCPTTSSSNSNSPLAISPSAQPPTLGIGVQPLLVVALLLIIVGVVGGVVRGRTGRLVAAGAALLAAGLVVVDNATAHTAIVNKLDSSVGDGAAGGSMSAAGLSGTVDSFFTIHAALGFILVLIALLLAALANGVALALGVTARPSVPPAPPPASVTG
ncbi:MAG TPA: hypothetical protein VH498_03910 [Candidatus Dormibacteraeota bacterium]|nr:hypothetical protein [Candidatus Dormibacteraeota bacterium]